MRTMLCWTFAAVGALGLCACAAEHEKDNDSDANEIKVTMDQLPDPVKATLLRESEGGSVADIDKEQKDDKTIYEADATIGSTPYELKVAQDGTLISKKLDDDEKDEKKD